MKRWKTAVGALAAFVLTAVLIVTALMTSGLLEDRLRKMAQVRASRALGAQVAIERLRLGFLPPSVRLDRIRAARRGNRGSEATLAVGTATIRGAALTLLGWRQGPLELTLDRPSLKLVIAEGRSLAVWEEAEPGSPGFAPPRGSTLTIRDGALDLELSGGRRLHLEGGEATLRAGEAPFTLRGHAEAADGTAQGFAGTWGKIGAEADFDLSPGRLRLDPISIHAEGLAVTAHLSTPLGGSPQFTGEARLGIDMIALSRFLPEGAVPAGRLEARLQGSWGPDGPRLQGDLGGVALRIFGLTIDSLRCDLDLGESLKATAVKAHLLGGEATGSLERAWKEPGASTQIDLGVDGVDLGQLLALAAWSGPAVRGTVHYHGRHLLDARGLAGLSGSGVFDAVGHYLAPKGGERPLEITSTLTSEGATVRLSGGTIRAGSVRGNFSGTVAEGEGIQLRLRGATGDIGEILPLFNPPAKSKPQPKTPAPAPSGAGPPPAPSGRASPVRVVAWRSEPPGESHLESILKALGGAWEWDGDLRYQQGHLSFDGRLGGRDLTYRDTPLGSLDSRILYRDEVLTVREAILHPGEGGEVRASGSVDFGVRRKVDLDVTAAEAPLAMALAVVGVTLPIEGRFGARVGIGGRPEALAAHATFETGAAHLGDLQIDRIEGEILATPDLIEARPLLLRRGKGQVGVTGRLPYRGASEGERVEAGGSDSGMTLEGRGLDLALWSRAAADRGLSGSVDLEGTITGSLDAPVGRVTFRSPLMRAAGGDAGPIDGELSVAEGVASFALRIPERNAKAEGSIRLEPGWPADLRATFSGSEGGVRLVLGALEEARVKVTGDVELHGPLRDPRALHGRAVFSAFEAGVAGVTVTAQAPVVLVLQEGRLGLEPVVLAGEGTRVELRGGLARPEDGALDLNALGRFDLRLLRPFLKNLQATGTGTIALQVGGTLENPDLRGTVEVVGEAIRYPELPCPVDNLTAHGTFEASGLTVDALHFEAGGGPVEGTGRVGIGLVPGQRARLAIQEAELHLRGTNVKSEFPDGFTSAADLDLTFRFDAAGPRLAGSVGIVKGVYGRDLKVDSAIARGASGFDPFESPVAPGSLPPIGLDLRIHADRDVWIRNDLGNLEGSGELRVTGTTTRPSVSGRITASEGGTLRFRGVRYRVDRGTIDFSDPETINPIFDLQATTSVKEYQVTLHVEGSADDFKYELTSSPALPQQQIVALLLTGHTLGQVSGTAGNLGEETAAAYLGGMFNDQFSGRVAGWAGLDVLAIDPFQTSAQGDPTTRVTLAKQVTPDLMLTYSSDLGSTQASIYEVDYSLSRDVTLTSLRDRTGSLGADLRYILRGKPPSLPGLETVPAAQGPGPRIGDVRFEGHPHFDERRLRARLRMRPGRPLSRAALNDGVDRLRRFYQDRGFLMAEVDVDQKMNEDGTVDLLVRARPGPRIVIDVQGLRGREGVRQRLAPYWQKGIFLEDIVEEARLRLLGFERDRGFQRAAIEAKVLRNDDEVFRVLYTVTPGPRIHAREIQIAGAASISEAAIRKVVKTRKKGAFHRGVVSDARLRDDVEAIRRLYLARGFARVSIAPPGIAIDESGERASVLFRIEEGPRIVLGQTRFEGAAALPRSRLDEAASMQPGVPYTSEEVSAALIRVRRAYDAAGFYQVAVESRLEPGQETAATQVVDVVFSIREGDRQVVQTVDVGGNLITDEDVLRRALVVKPGDPLSRAGLLESQRRLYQRGIFDAVTVEPAAPRPDPAAPSGPDGSAADPAPPPVRPVSVSVRESAPLSQVYGVGYDSVEKGRVQYDITHRNIFGSGRSLGLHTRVSELAQNASLLYRELGMFGGQYDGLATAFWQNERRPAFDVRTVGAAVQITRSITRATKNLFRYSLRDVDLSDISAAFEGTTLRLSGLAASVVHDTRDSAFQPLRGHYLSSEVQYYGHPIGSEADFGKLFSQAYFFKEVSPKTVWAQAIRAGVAVPLGRSRSDPASTGDAVSGLPPSERFFAGGDTTLRGFRRDRVGPLDAGGDPIGGEGVFVLNEELRFPIFRSLQGALFYDAGNVFRTSGDYTLGDLRHVLGAGLRIATPIGPFRFEYGAVLDRKPDEARGQFIVSIGQAF